MVRFQVQLTEAQSRKVKRVAAERQISVSALIRECVDKYMADYERELSEPRTKSR